MERGGPSLRVHTEQVLTLPMVFVRSLCKESLKAFPCLSKEKSPALFSAEVPHYKLFQCIVFCFTALNPAWAAYVFYFNLFSLFYYIYLDLIFFPPPKSVKYQVRCLRGAYVRLHKHLEILKNCRLSTRNSSMPFRMLYFHRGLCLPFKCFQVRSLEVPCLTRSPAFCSCCLLHSEEPSISF